MPPSPGQVDHYRTTKAVPNGYKPTRPASP